ncbi:hypothetical protein M408DRAFT_31222 [Serendipita vermifera MAFF 305830]|uniref:Protein kinase domain-containing protein n=1 Tax=Serendipita vermifera MAFF 305830 TaxID=933852 RepID=A0A0C2VYN5_SERVB|nr:hypothetical protein M408DRAFT_31222 [Serendipita vermifera MAFF 305830]
MAALDIPNIEEGSMGKQPSINVQTDRGYIQRQEVPQGIDVNDLLVGEEAKTWYKMYYHGTIIANRASATPGYELFDTRRSRLPDAMTSTISIPAKLAAYCKMHRECPWGLIYGGHHYMILLFHYTDNGITATCSPLLTITDRNSRLIPLIVYMVLTSVTIKDAIHEKLKVTVRAPKPAATEESPTPSSESPSYLSEDAEAENIDMQVGKGGTAMSFRRLDIPFSNRLLTTKLVLEPGFVQGAIGRVFRTTLSDGTRLVVKHAFPATSNELREEARVYTLLGAQRNIPAFYGLFHGNIGDIIILSDNGTQLESFSALKPSSRRQLYELIRSLHRSGVLHGDFVPRNVLSRPRPWWKIWADEEELTIIDFSHTSTGHKCSGESCEELQEVKSSLGLSTFSPPASTSCLTTQKPGQRLLMIRNHGAWPILVVVAAVALSAFWPKTF